MGNEMRFMGLEWLIIIVFIFLFLIFTVYLLDRRKRNEWF